MIELSDLHIFKSVVDAGGVTRAAHRLHRVPSNVSTRLQQLETRLGKRLFHRNGKRLDLTAEGEVLLEYAGRLLQLATEAEQAMQVNEPLGPLVIGAMENTAVIRLPPVLAQLHQRYPLMKLELTTAPSQQTVEKLLAAQVEVAFVADPSEDPRLTGKVVFREKLVLVAAVDQVPVQSPADLAQCTVLAFTSGCTYRRRLEQWFRQHAWQPDRVVEFNSYQAVLGCVVAGMGVALVPCSVLQDYPWRDSLSVHPMKDAMAAVDVWMLWRRDAVSPRVRALADLLSALD